MTLPPGSIRGVAFGRSGSGKTEYLKRVWIPRIPRLVIVDQTGEWRTEEEKHGGRADGLPAVLAAIKERAPGSTWRLVADLDREELEELSAILLPRGAIDRAPSRLLGGMGLMLDEVDQVAPVNGSAGIRSLFRRGRHAGLTIISASQRPGNVSKEVTAQCDFIAVLALHERNDVAYLESVMGQEVAREALAWANSAPYRVALYFPKNGALVCQEPAQE